MTNSKNKLVKNISSLFIMQIANYLLPLVSLPLVVRIIGPAHFGAINYAAAVVAYLVLLINYGFNFTATRAVARDSSNTDLINSTFNQVFFTKIFLLLAALLVFLGFYALLPDLRSDARVAWYSFAICAAWVLAPDWLYQGVQQLYRLAIFNSLTKLIFTVFILLVIRKESDYYLYPLLVSGSQILVAAASFFYAKWKFRIRLAWPGLSPLWHILVRDRAIFLSSIVISLYNTTNIIILGTVSNNMQVGYYTAAQRFIAISLSLISMPFAQSLFPYVSKAFGESRAEGILLVRKIAPIVIWFSFISASAMWLIGPWFTTVFYGSEFVLSRSMFRIMAFSPFLVSISNILGVQVMLNLHMDKWYFRITAAGALFSIVVTTLLSWKWGGFGTSWASISTEFLIVVMMFLYLSKKKISVIQWREMNPFAVTAQLRYYARNFSKR